MLNSGIWLLVCFVLIVIKYVFLLPHEDKRLYRMYEARDKVALMAAKNIISQDSDEYKFVMKTMQFEIYYCKYDYNFNIILKNLFFKPIRNLKKFTFLMGKAENNDCLREALRISYKEFIRKLNWRLNIFVIVVLYPIVGGLNIALTLCRLWERAFKIGKIAVKKISGLSSTMGYWKKDCKEYLKVNPYNIM